MNGLVTRAQIERATELVRARVASNSKAARWSKQVTGLTRADFRELVKTACEPCTHYRDLADSHRLRIQDPSVNRTCRSVPVLLAPSDTALQRSVCAIVSLAAIATSADRSLTERLRAS